MVASASVEPSLLSRERVKPALEVRKVPLGFEELFDTSLRHTQKKNKTPNKGKVVAGRALTRLANTRRTCPDNLVQR